MAEYLFLATLVDLSMRQYQVYYGAALTICRKRELLAARMFDLLAECRQTDEERGRANYLNSMQTF